MPQSATLPLLLTSKHSDEEKDALQATASLLTQSMEDLRLADRVGHALRPTGYGALRAIQVSLDARIVHIMGRVPSYNLKQIAQETALAIPGTHQIHNGLDVMPSNRRRQEVCRMQQHYRKLSWIRQKKIWREARPVPTGSESSTDILFQEIKSITGM